MARYFAVNQIINRVAAEVGLVPVEDPVSSTDAAFIQLKFLLGGAGQELVELHEWEILKKPYTFTTKSTDSGTYDLPDDFSRMVNQTGWDQSNNVHVAGPLSSQDWEYLAGRDLVSQTIYASFQLRDGKLQLYPQPPPPGVQISFLYLSRNWLKSATSERRSDVIEQGSDLVLFEPILTIKFLKALFLEAKGFDSNAARDEFGTMFNSRTGTDEGASILNAGRGGRRFPYLNAWYNVPDSGYGR